METERPDWPIVVGYDGSPHARLAVRWAAEEAERVKAPLKIVYALELLPEFAGAISDSTHSQVGRQAQEMVDEAHNEIRARHPDIVVSAEVHGGHAARMLCGLSALARMVVLGSRGRGNFTSLIAGSVSVAVATHAHCPVVVIRHLPPVDEGPVVVGVDDSAQSNLALQFGFSEAAWRGVPLVAVRAWHPPQAGPYLGGYLQAEQIAEIETVERRFVEDCIESAAKTYPDVQTHIQLVADTAPAALTAAAEHAQLVVVGSRGRGGFRGLLLGSVSLHLLHYAICPVAVVRDGASEATAGVP